MRKISYNNKQTVFHDVHNCPVRSIHWHLWSMLWIQCGNKDNPLFRAAWMLAILSVLALWGRKHQLDFKKKRPSIQKAHQIIAQTSLQGLIADFPLALLHPVGGERWMTPFMLLCYAFRAQRIRVGFLRAACFIPNDPFCWANKALLSLRIIWRRNDCVRF